MAISSSFLGLLAIVLLVSGVALLAFQYRKNSDQKRHMDGLLAGERNTDNHAALEKSANWKERIVAESSHWLDSKLGQQLVAEEDRALLVQCGYQTSNSKTYFLLSRVGLSLLLPLLAMVAGALIDNGSYKLMLVFAAFVVGFLAPKWFLRRQAANRSKQAGKELLVLVDILGLLQGAGLGMDQSLQLIARDFRDVMPVMAGELEMANRLHASGRTREQALSRMSEMFHSDALADLSALIVQIDKHGGAVQEPLRQFGERLREQRRMRMKEDIGKITVKMTGVMVLTLLPSLLIVTAGPGFLSVIRALGGM
jgi:tight adherence protein C